MMRRNLSTRRGGLLHGQYGSSKPTRNFAPNLREGGREDAARGTGMDPRQAHEVHRAMCRLKSAGAIAQTPYLLHRRVLAARVVVAWGLPRGHHARRGLWQCVLHALIHGLAARRVLPLHIRTCGWLRAERADQVRAPTGPDTYVPRRTIHG